jgi:hypothetical protein
VVGEDVVDLVPPPARGEPPDVRPLAIAVLHLRLRSADGGRLLDVLVVRVAVLREAEVHESAMPGLLETHRKPIF